MWPLAARAQSTGKKYTIGYLSAGSPGLEEATAAFTYTLRELGWVEGKNVTTDAIRLRIDEIETDILHAN